MSRVKSQESRVQGGSSVPEGRGGGVDQGLQVTCGAAGILLTGVCFPGMELIKRSFPGGSSARHLREISCGAEEVERRGD